VRVAVIVAAAVTGTGQLPAREYSARIDRDQPMQAGEDPYQRCRRIIHITCRCVIFSLFFISDVSCSWTDFLRQRLVPKFFSTVPIKLSFRTHI